MSDEGKNNQNQQNEDVAASLEAMKAELEETKKQLDTHKKGKDSLEKELENAKMELLSPDYLNYIESKQSKGKKSDIDNPDEIEGMTNTQLINYLSEKLSEAFDSFTKDNIAPLKNSVADLVAREEVRMCEAKYKDFNEYRPDMIKLVNSNENLRIEEAYKIAKSNRKIEKEREEAEREAKATAEKPGGPAGRTTVPKDFKSKNDAANDAWEQVMGNKNEL